MVIAVLAVVWFLAQTIFLATHVLHGIGPDEKYHVTLTGMHAETGKLHLVDSADTYELGLLSTRPYLYHYLLGTALQTKVSEILWLRMANILLGVFYLLFAWLLAFEFSRDRLTAAFTLVILTNVMMLVFLFSMVSYDNLTNLVAAANAFFLVRFFNRQEAWAFWGVILSVLIGSLTKITYLPLLFALQLLLCAALLAQVERIPSESSSAQVEFLSMGDSGVDFLPDRHERGTVRGQPRALRRGQPEALGGVEWRQPRSLQQ